MTKGEYTATCLGYAFGYSLAVAIARIACLFLVNVAFDVVTAGQAVLLTYAFHLMDSTWTQGIILAQSAIYTRDRASELDLEGVREETSPLH
jgi:hypothetical protein